MAPPSSSKIRAFFAFPYIFCCRIQPIKPFYSETGPMEVCLTQTTPKDVRKCKNFSYFATNRGAIIYGSPCKYEKINIVFANL